MEVKTISPVKRSPKWATVRKRHLLKESSCQWCGASAHLEVHHIIPFHIDRSKELDPTNLLTLCEQPNYNCHRKVGHLGNWKKYNPKAREICEDRQIRNREKAEPFLYLTSNNP